jgi:PKD repeat protein
LQGTNFLTNWSLVNRFQTFNPATIANTLVWFDGNKVTQSGGRVSSWTDLSGNGNNAIQTDTAGQPTYIQNNSLLNNNSNIRLDGVNDNVTFTRITNGRTFFLVFKHKTGSQDYPGVLGDISQYAFTTGPGTNFLDPGLNPEVTNGKIYVNGELRSWNGIHKPTVYTLMTFIPTSDLSVDQIASDRHLFSSGRGWNGDYAEVMINSTPLNDTVRIKTENYLLSKYGPPIVMKDTIVNGNFCDPVTITAPDMYTQFAWSNNANTQSTSFNANGEQGLTAVSQFNQESQTDFLVYPYVRFNNASVYLCQGDTFKLNMSLPVGFTVLWSTGSTSKNISLAQSGTYSVKVTDNKSCFYYDTLNVVIDNPALSPTPDASSNLRMCINEKLFVTTPTSFDSIRWSTGSTATFIVIAAPGTYNVFARTNTGCIVRDTFNITLAGLAPTADFVSTNLCEKSAASFTDISTIPVGNSIANWKWTFGDGNIATVQDPTNIYNSIGIYQASLKITTNVGCSDSTVKTIIIKKKPQAEFYNLLSCSGNPTTFVDNSIANSDSIQSWAWDFAGLGTSVQKNPKFNYPAASIYNTFLKVTNSFGCNDTITHQTIVNPSPVADFKADSSCLGSFTTFTNLSTVALPYQITNYLWEYGDEAQSIQVSQPHLYDNYGIYNVRLSIRSSNQCTDTVEKLVRVFSNPNVDFTISNTQCTGKEIQFTDVSTTLDGTPLNNWQWFFSGQGTSTLQNPIFTFNTQGNYTIQLTGKTAIGCSGSKFRSIAVTSPPLVKFNFSPSYGPPPLNVTYTNSSPNNSNYIWDYGDGSATYLGYTPPSHTYTITGTYSIKLLATDFKGCSDSLVKDILVDVAVIDGVMVSVSIVPDGDFYKVVATILNNSNIEITSLGLTIRLANGSEIREMWTGSLKPGQTVIYPFTGELRYNSNGDIPVICATIESINVNALEADVSNNSTCKEITVGQFDVLTIYPNPSTDNVNLGVMLPVDGEVEITVYDILGKLQYGVKLNGIKGYNNFRIPTFQFNAAMYIAEVKYDGAVIRKMIMRGNK